MSTIKDRCFACNRELDKGEYLVDTRDSQLVFVGKNCYKKITNSGEAGYQPLKGGPRLYLRKQEMDRVFPVPTDTSSGGQK